MAQPVDSTGSPTPKKLRMREYDILMISDLRSPGGTSATIAEEIAAQRRAGYRTALLHVPRLTRRRLRMFNPKVANQVWRGAADLITDDEPIRCRLLLVRHPGVFSHAPNWLPPVHADVHLMVVNQVPRDTTQPNPFYDVPQIRSNLLALFGAEFGWVPIGPLVRESLQAEVPDLDLVEDDWVNTLDVDEWAAERPPLAGRRPVIGRHSRSHYRKWSPEADQILAAYPDSDEFVVKVLGGIEFPVRTLGYQPANWVDYPFNSISAKRFCSEIDFFVYFHHPGLVEAFGRAPLEAMASGAVAILPAQFADLFGDAAVYAEVDEVAGLVRRFAADQQAFDRQSARGQQFAREHFSYEIPARRIAGMIGPATHEPDAAVPPPVRRPILLVCTGGGRAIERTVELGEGRVRGLQPVIVTTNDLLDRARASGAPVEAVPPAHHLHDPATAGALLSERLAALVDRLLPVTITVVGDSEPPAVAAVAAERNVPRTRIDVDDPRWVQGADAILADLAQSVLA